MYESRRFLELSPCLSRRELMGLTGDFKGQHKKYKFHCQDISCLSQENFVDFIKERNQRGKFTTSFHATQTTSYIMFVHHNNIVNCVSDLMFAKARL